jgi:hypothetical protein
MTSQKRIFKMVSAAFVIILGLFALAFAQTQTENPIVQQWGGVIAAFINSVAVLGIVQVLKIAVPKMKESAPWLIPIIAGAIGPAAAAGQNYLSGLLGVAIQLDPIVAIFTGGAAVAINQVGKQIQKAAGVILLVSALALSMSGCATAPNSQNPGQDEARMMIASFQKSLSMSFDLGKAYVALHPEKQSEWKTKVVPIFDAVNKALKDLETKGASGQAITVLDVTNAVTGQMAQINAALMAWGVNK